MTSPIEPYFMEWVIVDANGWALKEDAPLQVVEDYKEFMQDMDELDEINMVDEHGNNIEHKIDEN